MNAKSSGSHSFFFYRNYTRVRASTLMRMEMKIKRSINAMKITKILLNFYAVVSSKLWQMQKQNKKLKYSFHKKEIVWRKKNKTNEIDRIVMKIHEFLYSVYSLRTWNLFSIKRKKKKEKKIKPNETVNNNVLGSCSHRVVTKFEINYCFFLIVFWSTHTSTQKCSYKVTVEAQKKNELNKVCASSIFNFLYRSHHCEPRKENKAKKKNEIVLIKQSRNANAKYNSKRSKHFWFDCLLFSLLCSSRSQSNGNYLHWKLLSHSTISYFSFLIFFNFYSSLPQSEMFLFKSKIE